MSSAVILAVDDKPDNLFVLEQIISEYLPACKIITAQNAEKGLDFARKNSLDLAIIDVQMPCFDGIRMCRCLKEDPQTAGIPVILLTAHRAGTDLKVKGLNAGADDFITKPFDSFELIARIKVMLRIKKAEDILRQEKKGLEKKVSEKSIQLETAEKQYKALFNNVNDPIFVRDFDGNIFDANQAACDTLGYNVQELLKMKIQEIASPENAALIPSRTHKMRQQGKLVYESACMTRDGDIIPIEVSGRVSEYDNKPAILTIWRDLRERKQAESEKRNLQMQLQQAQKMEAIGTLAGGIAHDFNNILFPIIGYTEMTMDDVPKNSQAYKNLTEILKAAQRAAKLVEHILTFSRSRGQERAPMKIHLVIKEALKLIRAAIPKTINLYQDIDENCGPVLADPTQIHQIVMNLCINAYHAMQHQDAGGDIRLALKEVEIRPEDNIELKNNPGIYLRLMVSDTGQGMDDLVKQRIFEPYYTTKEKNKGTGMGLSVVHGIVKSYGGAITVFSKPGAGTTFYVYLPRLDIHREPQAVVFDSPAASRGSEHILLVDDEDQIVLMEEKTLTRLGYRVTSKTSSLDAFEIFRKQPDQFDLVITDQAMPNMAGMQLAHNMIQIRPDIPIILCTGFSEVVNEDQAKAAGIKEFLMKPLVKKDLAETIRKVLS
ncbi:Two component system sensor histidine kinase, PAS domain-containing [Desulfonema limicola]|uniref:histidine kinase n=1 Tax=Desulfonema limicola TaxID=45656 RepID=A0A975B4H3_9BACT|nr:response regulator [Desulfonema limicola]QTA78635.1 Two component system sensor histidine kinase, PAS domain-containing [Desulfonema limicola]